MMPTATLAALRVDRNQAKEALRGTARLAGLGEKLVAEALDVMELQADHWQVIRALLRTAVQERKGGTNQLEEYARLCRAARQKEMEEAGYRAQQLDFVSEPTTNAMQ